jgi:ParB-like chromosome segregation protein Spo0J
MIADDLLPLARPIDTLKPLEGNPRKGDVQAVMRSYDKFGQRKPIVALRDGTVIAGNHQLKAARELGWTEIAVVFVEDDEQTAHAFALADNRTSDLGAYDNEALAEMLQAVAIDPELLTATGFDEAFLEDLLMSLEPMPMNQLADEWEKNQNRNNDGTEKTTVTLLLDKEIADEFKGFIQKIGNEDAAIRRLLNASG